MTAKLPLSERTRMPTIQERSQIERRERATRASQIAKAKRALAPPRLDPRTSRALDLMVEGKSVDEAAAALGMNPRALKQALRKPHVMGAYGERLRLRTAGEVGKSINRMTELRDQDDSKYVALDAATRLVKLSGFEPPERPPLATSSGGIRVEIREVRPDGRPGMTRVIENGVTSIVNERGEFLGFSRRDRDGNLANGAPDGPYYEDTIEGSAEPVPAPQQPAEETEK